MEIKNLTPDEIGCLIDVLSLHIEAMGDDLDWKLEADRDMKRDLLHKIMTICF